MIDRPKVPFETLPLPQVPLEGMDIEGLDLEHVSVTVEQGERCPLLLVKKTGAQGKLRPIFVLHGTMTNKLDLLQNGHLQRYARMGFIAIGVDSRHTGDRVPTDEKRVSKNPRGNQAYWDAVYAAWRQAASENGQNGQNGHAGPRYRYPFIWDFVWDLMRLLDWVQEERAESIDTTRVGMTGISLGGMNGWFWQALDTRLTHAAPGIGVQSFRYALDHECWQARVNSLGPAFKSISEEVGRPTDTEMVREAWNRLLPGVLDRFDAEFTLPCIAPRHVLIANSASDPRCPRAGVDAAVEAARPHWKGYEHRFRLIMDESNGTGPLPADQFAKGHVITPAMWSEIDKFLERTVLLGEES